jgi:hypothetical protein
MNEWAALALLDSLAPDDPPAPRFYGGDTSARVLVMEDLGAGDGTTTDALAFGDDPARASEGFAEHAALIGRLHALPPYPAFGKVMNAE